MKLLAYYQSLNIDFILYDGSVMHKPAHTHVIHTVHFVADKHIH